MCAASPTNWWAEPRRCARPLSHRRRVRMRQEAARFGSANTAGRSDSARLTAKGPLRTSGIVRTAVRGLAKTEGDDIAECEWCANQEGRGLRTPAAKPGTPPLKFRN